MGLWEKGKNIVGKNKDMFSFKKKSIKHLVEKGGFAMQ